MPQSKFAERIKNLSPEDREELVKAMQQAGVELPSQDQGEGGQAASSEAPIDVESLTEEQTQAILSEIAEKDPDAISTISKGQAATQGVREPEPNGAAREPEPPMPGGAPGVREGEDPMTSRPFKYANLIAATRDAKKFNRAKVELEMHHKLEEAGFQARSGGTLVPFNAAYLEVSYPNIFKGWLRDAMTEGYHPSSYMESSLAHARQKGINSETVKSLVSDEDDRGGFLLDTQKRNEVIDLLRAELVLQELGMRELTLPPSGRLELPKKTQGTTATRRREQEQMNEQQDLNLGVISLQAKQVYAFVETTNELLSRASMDVEQMVREDMAIAIAEREEQDFIYGHGTTDEPRGFRNWNIHEVTPANGANNLLAPADTLEPQTVLKEANVRRIGPYLVAPRPMDMIRSFRAQEFDSDANQFESVGPYLFQEFQSMEQGPAGRLRGRPVFESNFIDTDINGGGESEFFIADWSQVTIGRGAALEIASDESIGFRTNTVVFRAILEDDLVVQNEDAVAVLGPFTTS